MDLAPCMPKPRARSISEGSRPWRESITWANPAKWPVRGKGVGKPSRLFRSHWNGVRDVFMELVRLTAEFGDALLTNPSHTPIYNPVSQSFALPCGVFQRQTFDSTHRMLPSLFPATGFPVLRRHPIRVQMALLKASSQRNCLWNAERRSPPESSF